jgi:fructokinase
MFPRTVKIFDANLRQSYYSPEALTQSMRLADIAKLNDEELPKIMSLNNVSHKEGLSSAEWLVRTYDLKLVSITRGGRGSPLVRATESSEHPGFRVRVADTVHTTRCPRPVISAQDIRIQQDT